MRRIPTIFELTVSAAIILFGSYALFQGISNNRENDDSFVVIAGGVLLAIGGMALVLAIKSLLWHWQMVRQTEANEDLDGSVPLLGSKNQNMRIDIPPMSARMVPNQSANHMSEVLGGGFQSLSGLGLEQPKVKTVVADPSSRERAKSNAVGARN